MFPRKVCFFFIELSISEMASLLDPVVSAINLGVFLDSSLTHTIHSISRLVPNPLTFHSTTINPVKAIMISCLYEGNTLPVSLISCFPLIQKAISHTEPTTIFLKHKPDYVTSCSQPSVVGQFFQLHMEHFLGQIIC